MHVMNTVILWEKLHGQRADEWLSEHPNITAKWFSCPSLSRVVAFPIFKMLLSLENATAIDLLHHKSAQIEAYVEACVRKTSSLSKKGNIFYACASDSSDRFVCFAML